MRNNNINYCLFIILLFNSCSYPKISFDEQVYFNDFENNNLEKIDGGNIINYNQTNILGNYNNDGFIIHIDDVDDHDYIFISFELYIHGSWDGNANGFSNNDKPDKWILEIDPYMSLHSDSSSNRFETTFSNSVCYPNYCLRQSYPQDFPSLNNPTTGSLETNLPALCNNSFFGGPTSLYKIEKGIKHKGKSIVIKMSDELYQPNAIDKDGIPQQKCDESWSIDNLSIRIIKYE
tara:strand:+ start:218 stop:919 length:702 start_codon:yes stop_codon:yes gene_type:complete